MSDFGFEDRGASSWEKRNIRVAKRRTVSRAEREKIHHTLTTNTIAPIRTMTRDLVGAGRYVLPPIQVPPPQPSPFVRGRGQTQKRALKKKIKPRRRARTHWTIDHALLSLGVILSFGIGVGVYALFGAPERGENHNLFAATAASLPTTTAPSKEVPALILEETAGDAKIDVTGVPRAEVIADLAILFGKTVLGEDHTRNLVFTGKVGKKSGPIDAPSFFGLMAPHIPQSLVRAVDKKDYRVGIYGGERNEGFIVLTVKSYPHAAGGMREWEKHLVADMLPVLAPWRSRASIETVAKRPFADMRLENGIDARGALDAGDAIALSYAFVNNRTRLIIASSPDALAGVAESMSNP